MKIGINDNLNQKLSFSVSPPNSFMYNSTSNASNTKPKSMMDRPHQSPITPRRPTPNISIDHRVITPLMHLNTTGPAVVHTEIPHFNISSDHVTPLMLQNTTGPIADQFVLSKSVLAQRLPKTSPTGSTRGSVPVQTSTPVIKPTISI